MLIKEVSDSFGMRDSLKHKLVWSDRRGSNPRPLAWEAKALPTELLSQLRMQRYNIYVKSGKKVKKFSFVCTFLHKNICCMQKLFIFVPKYSKADTHYPLFNNLNY